MFEDYLIITLLIHTANKTVIKALINKTKQYICSERFLVKNKKNLKIFFILCGLLACRNRWEILSLPAQHIIPGSCIAIKFIFSSTKLFQLYFSNIVVDEISFFFCFFLHKNFIILFYWILISINIRVIINLRKREFSM